MPELDYSLYVATDSSFVSRNGEDKALSILEECLARGVSVLQLRLKSVPAYDFYRFGRRLRELTTRFQVPLIINDRFDLALALRADGVHVGRSDLPPEVVRRLMPGGVIGYSVNTLEHLQYAESVGVDYVGVGPVFATGTKADTGPVLGINGLREIVGRASVPCIAIGGISDVNIAQVMSTGVAGVCVISAVLGAAEPADSVLRIRKLIDSCR